MTGGAPAHKAAAPVIVARGLSSGYDVEQLARVFFPRATPAQGKSTRGNVVYARAGAGKLAAGVRLGGVCAVCVRRLAAGSAEKDKKTTLCRMLYDIMVEITGERPPWGMLTGVRPVNHLRKRTAERGEGGARDYFIETCDVSPRKYDIAKEILDAQSAVLAAAPQNAYSLYAGIPFCPSRCSYCSFVSQSIEKELGLAEAYVDALTQELAATAAAADKAGLRLATLYIGGGTPTSLPHAQLEKLMRAVNEAFDVPASLEYTVEAGRPDCTDLQKLKILKRYGATRVSVNPQSLSDEVLAAIGRRHTAEDFFTCYANAQKAGFKHINVDLIAGLPKDTPETFANTLKQVIALGPSNITLHTLTIKRGASLRNGGGGYPDVPGGYNAAAQTASMLEAAYAALQAAGYRPYYLYRQKATPSNLENTGWMKHGDVGLYNVFIMEEAHIILACGAGASTKVVLPGQNLIKREYNPKFPAEYCANIADVLRRKEGVVERYAGHLDSETPR